MDKDRFDTVVAEQIHRRYAIIEQISAEPKNDDLAHMPFGVFNANATWVAIPAITHNLLRAVVGLSGGRMDKVRAQTLRTRIISIPARLAHGARRLILLLPTKKP